jgi:hypothetical protein
MDGYKGDFSLVSITFGKQMIKWKALGLLIMSWYNKDWADVSPLFFYFDEFFFLKKKTSSVWSGPRSHREKGFAYVWYSLFPSLLSSFHSSQCMGVKMKDIPHRQVMYQLYVWYFLIIFFKMHSQFDKLVFFHDFLKTWKIKLDQGPGLPCMPYQISSPIKKCLNDDRIFKKTKKIKLAINMILSDNFDWFNIKKNKK